MSVNPVAAVVVRPPAVVISAIIRIPPVIAISVRGVTDSDSDSSDPD